MTQKTLTRQYEVKLHQQVLKLFHASGMKLHDNTLGSRVYTNYQRLSLIVLFMRSRKALRDFVAELHESKWSRWLGLREIPSKSVLHNWLKRWDLSWVRQILATTVANETPSTMAIDATGFDSWAQSRHYAKRLKECGLRNQYLPYNKADLLILTRSLFMILSWGQNLAMTCLAQGRCSSVSSTKTVWYWQIRVMTVKSCIRLLPTPATNSTRQSVISR